MPPKKMEAKVAALESEVASIRSAIREMQLKAEENQERLVALLTKGVKNADGEASSGKITKETVSGNSETSGLKKLHDESLEEFRQPVKRLSCPCSMAMTPQGGSQEPKSTFRCRKRAPR